MSFTAHFIDSASKIQNQTGSPPSGFKRVDLYLDALFDQILDGEGQIPSVEESESCDLENKEPGSAGY